MPAPPRTILRCVLQTVARACRLVNNSGHARRNAGDFALGIAAFALLFMWKTPPWLGVVFGAVGGAPLTFVPFGS